MVEATMHFLLALSLSFCTPKSGPVIPDKTVQLVVGIAPAWDAKIAILYRFERKLGGKWKRVGPSWGANIGRSGLAAGRGLLAWCGPDSERKVEHDWKAPAGAFYFGGMYGFGPGLKAAPRGRLTPITPTMVCVSDPESKYYNRIVDAAPFKDKLPWDWARPLQRPDGIKSRTIMVGMNGGADPAHDPPVAGEGSCVLFHLARGNRPTVGCTSLPAEALDALIAWLKPKSKPIYVLMTHEQYDALAALPKSGLPSIPSLP
jgi:D-alanyl-D-alanine dipeptidase